MTLSLSNIREIAKCLDVMKIIGQKEKTDNVEGRDNVGARS